MRKVQVHVVSSGDAQQESFFEHLEKLLTTTKHIVSSQKEKTLEDGRTLYHIIFSSDTPVQKIRDTLNQSTAQSVRVYCPLESTNTNNSGKRRARRKAGRRKAQRAN